MSIIIVYGSLDYRYGNDVKFISFSTKGTVANIEESGWIIHKISSSEVNHSSPLPPFWIDAVLLLSSKEESFTISPSDIF